MNDFYLSRDQNEMIDQFHANPLKGPLIIYGQVGSGKSTLALQILKNTHIIKIDSSMIRNNPEIEKLIESLSKQSITLMFNNHKKRSLIIDDFSIFYKDDKRNYHMLLKILPSISKSIPCVVITDPQHIKNRKLSKISSHQMSLKRSYYLYYRLASTVLQKEGISRDRYDKIIYQSGGNLHRLKSYKSNINSYDQFYNLDSISDKILRDQIKPNDLIRYCQGHDTSLSLNLLDNVDKILPKKRHIEIVQLYRYSIDSDIIETHATKYHLWDMLEYSLIVGIYPYQKYRSSDPPKINYNCYLSKSIAQIASQKSMVDNLEKICDSLCTYLKNPEKGEKSKSILQSITPSLLNKYISLIEKYFHIKNKNAVKSLMISS